MTMTIDRTDPLSNHVLFSSESWYGQRTRESHWQDDGFQSLQSWMQGESVKAKRSESICLQSELETSHFGTEKDAASPGLIWIDLKSPSWAKAVRRDLGESEGGDLGFTGLGYDPRNPDGRESETREFRIQVSQLGPGTSNRVARFFLFTQKKLRELALAVRFGDYHLNETLEVRSDPDVLGILEQLFFTPGYLSPPTIGRWNESEVERIAKICMWLATVPAIQVPITSGRKGIDLAVHLGERCPTPSGWLWGVFVLGPSLERNENGP